MNSTTDSIYGFTAERLDGRTTSLDTYRGKVLLIVNTASECGFTPQYRGLQELYTLYAGRGFEVLGFPCNQFGKQEPGDAAQIGSFCESNYGVTFPMFAKIDVNGPNAHPLFKYLTEKRAGRARARSDQMELHEVPDRPQREHRETLRADHEARVDCGRHRKVALTLRESGKKSRATCIAIRRQNAAPR